MSPLPPAAARVKTAADAIGLGVEISLMPDSTRTAQEAAAACGCAVAQIVKSLIFRGKDSGKPYLFLVSGTNRVNETGVGGLIGEALARPDAAYVREITGFAIGGIPPFGHATTIRTLIDQDLLQYGTVWAAAGTPNAVFAVDPRRLSAALGAEVIRVT